MQKGLDRFTEKTYPYRH